METADSAGRGPGAMARHIAGVAARLFATRGYGATSVRTIAEEAGVTKPTLYYHFGSKEGLAQALLTAPMTELVAATRAILEGAGDPVQTLARITEAHFAFCREDPDRARFLFALLFGPLGAGLEDEMKRFGDTFAGLITEAVRHLADAGLIASDRVADATRACRGLMVIAMLDFLYRGDLLEPGLGRRLVDDLLRGFAVESPSKSV
jgi:AcrR family transcriptional regulator